ncbi:glycosyltransferase family 9 protein [Halobacteriovorax marinus]|uniref:glycosyltransferase family 9 protein n=1 Tax=Halobacteriovorax marinus TaxID=97084 RepID=UPI003A947D64
MTYRTILVVKNRAMGDSIMGLSTLQYIRKLYPEAKIIYAIPSWITPLYKNVEIECDEVINCDLKVAKDWAALLGRLRKIKPDVIFEMQLSGRTFKFFNIYSKLFGIPYFFHDHHSKKSPKSLKDRGILDQGVIKAVIQRDLDGAYSCLGGDDQVPNYLSYVPKISFEKAPKNRLVLGVVATRATKMWPLEYYVELAKICRRNYPNLSIKIPLSKSLGDIEIKERLEELNFNDYGEIVHVPLSQLPRFVGNSKLYVGNDTGLKHLAISTGVKSYTLFGPEPPNEWHPYDNITHPYFYKDPLECRTRDAHYCGLSNCSSMICLNEFMPTQIFDEIKKDLDD